MIKCRKGREKPKTREKSREKRTKQRKDNFENDGVWRLGRENTGFILVGHASRRVTNSFGWITARSAVNRPCPFRL
jgi:hypothetical protein